MITVAVPYPSTKLVHLGKAGMQMELHSITLGETISAKDTLYKGYAPGGWRTCTGQPG